MGDQIFKKITNEELAALTNSQFHKIKILDIIFDCRSHISEYVQIYIAFNGVDVQDPVLYSGPRNQDNGLSYTLLKLRSIK